MIDTSYFVYKTPSMSSFSMGFIRKTINQFHFLPYEFYASPRCYGYLIYFLHIRVVSTCLSLGNTSRWILIEFYSQETLRKYRWRSGNIFFRTAENSFFFCIIDWIWKSSHSNRKFICSEIPIWKANKWKTIKQRN